MQVIWQCLNNQSASLIASSIGNRNLDIRDAILQLLNVIREGNKKLIQHDKSEGEISNQVLKKLNTITSTEAIEKKIDNISTFLLRFDRQRHPSLLPSYIISSHKTKHLADISAAVIDSLLHLDN